ncbi:MAG: Crp/Fnr family transcriptional regulator [Gracilibacteraceae bacterium]|jgi:CRP/FNR family transcriptional regulator|nr:Crp/Fnr family transcriptional regulator [Gracilibacteraceae bacterium]
MGDDAARIIPEILIPESFYSVEGLEKYLHLGQTREFRKGEVILAQGVPNNSMLYVQSGCLSVNMCNEDGDNKFMFLICERSIGMSVFLSELHELLITATEAARLCFFTMEQALEIFRQDEQIMLDVLQNILSKVYYFMAQSRDLNFSRPSTRIFRLLYNLALTEGRLENGVQVVRTRLTQKAIGEITGAHYVTVSKLFNYLEKHEILTKHKDRICIYDMVRLKSLINEVIEY